MSFQVTMSHRGKLNRCGISWKIKQASATAAEHRLPLLRRVLVLGPARESQRLRSVQTSLPSLKDILWARPVPLTPTPKSVLANMFNMSMEVKETSTDF